MGWPFTFQVWRQAWLAVAKAARGNEAANWRVVSCTVDHSGGGHGLVRR